MTSISPFSETVRIDGPSGVLEGELLSVEGAERIVVILPGSGPVDRDGNALPLGLHTDSYRKLAEGLADAGVASLRIDKRGLFGSAGALADPNDVTVEAYADDTQKWIARAGESAPDVWLAGHSEGGLIALASARQTPKSALGGLILMATAGRPIGNLLIEQLRALPGNAPLMPEIEATVSDLESGRRRAADTLPQELRTLFADGLQGYLIDLFSQDPVRLARDWTGTALILQGDSDLQVKPCDATLLAEAMPQADCRILPGLTHMLKSDLPGQPYATYTDPSLPLHPGVVPALAAAIRRNGP